MKRRYIGLLGTLAAVLLVAIALLSRQAETEHTLAGPWHGTLDGPDGDTLHLVLVIRRSWTGSLSVTAAVPNLGLADIDVSEPVVTGGTLQFTIPAARGAYEGAWSAESRSIEGVWRQDGAAQPLVLTAGAFEWPARPQQPEPPFPYFAEDVRFSNVEAGIELAATLTLPSSQGPHPVAVLISGSGAQDRDEALSGHRPFLVLADHLTRSGIAVLRYDDRGFGESSGTFARATIEDFATDAEAAVAYLTARPEIDSQRIGLIGHSEGALVAPMVAARSSDVAFIVLLAGPGLSGFEVFPQQSELLMRANGVPERAIRTNVEMLRAVYRIVLEEADTRLHFHAAVAPRIRNVMQAALDELSVEELQSIGRADRRSLIRQTLTRVTSPWFRFALSYDPRTALERVTVPVLALNGDMDLQVWHEQNLPAIERALERAGNEDVTIRTLQGLNHLFQTARTGAVTEYGTIDETFAPIALNAISEWILERFSPSAAR